LNIRKIFFLLLLTIGALLVHGYHPYAEDAEIYLPGIEKILHPQLFPFGSQFFLAHAHLTFFPNLIAASVRLTHLSLPWALFLWHVASIFLFLLACWKLTALCFTDTWARWAAVGLIAALFTLPIAGTALYVMDQYLNPRNLTAFAGIFAIVKVLQRNYVQAALFLVLAALIHPLMPMFVLLFSAILVAVEHCMADARPAALPMMAAALLPFGIGAASPAYHQVALLHHNHYLFEWAWYEWVGALAPIAILWWFSRIAKSRGLSQVDVLCRAAIVFEVINVAGALVLSTPPFEMLARLQPMRSLYLVYIVMLLLGGAFLGEYLLKTRVWRWLVLFGLLCGGMFYAQRQLFPASAHVEWPWTASKNKWVQAFEWIRKNTPPEAIFALDPHHMQIAGEDENGFRAVAERSMLADDVKDSGAVTMFPPNAEEWLRETHAQKGWNTFQQPDFERLQRDFNVSWVVLQQPGVSGLDCPYHNDAVQVCRLN